MNEKKELENLIPGKKVTEFRGEIKNYTIHDWGIEGLAKREEIIYRFRIKRSREIRNFICAGLTIKIINGFCIKNKKGELLITDGKFGEAIVFFDLKNYISSNLKTTEKELITGIIRNIHTKKNHKTITLEHILFLDKVLEIELSNNIKLISEEKYYIGKIVRLEYQTHNGINICDHLEVLLMDNIIYRAANIDNNTHNLRYLIPLIKKQQEVLMNTSEILIEELILLKGTLSKSDKQKIEEIIREKIAKNNLRPLFILFLPDSYLIKYFNELIDFVKKTRDYQSEFKSVREVLDMIKYYYPPLKIQNIL